MWAIEFTSKSRKDLDRLPIVTQSRIANFLDQRVALHENPRLLAKSLAGSRDGLWRFRVGDFRIVARFEDSKFVVLLVQIDNRRDVYR